MDSAIVEETLVAGALPYHPPRQRSSRNFEMDAAFLAEAEAVLAAGAAKRLAAIEV